MSMKSMSKAERHYRGLLAEAEASGKTLKAFSEERGLPQNRLSWWRHHLKEKALREAPKLLPVRLVEPELARPAAPCDCEIVLKGGRVLRVPADLDMARIAALVLALEASC